MSPDNQNQSKQLRELQWLAHFFAKYGDEKKAQEIIRGVTRNSHESGSGGNAAINGEQGSDRLQDSI